MPVAYAAFIDVIAKVFLALGVLAAAICVMDWAIRTRKISPFSGVARLFRNRIDPLMRPVEAKIVRLGGMPSSAPVWVLLIIAVSGIIAIQLLRFIGELLMQLSVAAANPRLFPMLLVDWAFQILLLALIVRVISSWLPISPYSKWIRWSYVMTEWLLAPIRRVVPPFRSIDLSPIIAYFLILIVTHILGV
jgi:YggT family protein